MSVGTVKGVPVNTLYKKIENSNQVQFVKDKPFMAAAGATGSVVIAAKIMDSSKIALQIGQKGVIPAIATGVAITGAAMIHDTLVNNTDVQDDKNTPENEHTRHIAKNAAKISGGTAMILAGTEVVGRSYDVSLLKPIKALVNSQLVEKAAPPVIALGLAGAGAVLINDALNGDEPADILSNDPKENMQAIKNTGKAAAGIALISGSAEIIGRRIGLEDVIPHSLTAAVATTGVVISLAAAKNMKDNGVGVINSTALTAGSTLTTSMVTGLSMLNKKNDLATLGKTTGIVGGAGLGLMSYALIKKSKSELSEGHKNIAALSAVGAAGAAVASIHVLGNATGVEALSGLAPKVFGKNPVVAAAVIATGLSVGSYVIYSNNKENEKVKN